MKMMWNQGFKVAIRRLNRQKHFALINLVGLAVGMGASFLLLFYVMHERSFDHRMLDAEHVYRILSVPVSIGETEAKTHYPVADILTREIPDAVAALRLSKLPLVTKTKDEFLKLPDCYSAGTSIDAFYPLQCLEGSLQDWAKDPRGILLSRSESLRLLGEEEALGQVIHVTLRDKPYALTVRGVYADLPMTLTMRPQSICREAMNRAFWRDIFHWLNHSPAENWELPAHTTLVQLKPEAVPEAVAGKLNAIAALHGNKHRFVYRLQPLNDLYLGSNHLNGHLGVRGSAMNLWVFSGIALLILLIATVNYILMGTAQAATRIKEISVRKVVGANRPQIAGQVLSESVLTAFLALPLAFIVVEGGMPLIQRLLHVQLGWEIMQCPVVAVVVLGITLLTGLLSGGYLALHLSHFEPILLLKKRQALGNRKSLLRQVLIAFQLMSFILLIGICLHIDRQLDFVLNHDPGYDTVRLHSLNMGAPALRPFVPSFKAALATIPGVAAVTAANDAPPTGSKAVIHYSLPQTPEVTIEMESFDIDVDFLEVMGIPLISGDLPAVERLAGAVKYGVINETAARLLGGQDMIGQKVHDVEIVAVARNFHMHSLHEKIMPMILTYDVSCASTLLFRLDPAQEASALAQIEDLWRKQFQDRPFHIRAFDEGVGALYMDEVRFQTMMQTFMLLAIFVAMIGLFGFSLYVGEQRRREIAIRKVMGASNLTIMRLMVVDFISLAVMATAVAAPLIQIAMDHWLEHFAYHVQTSIMVIVYAGLMGLVVTAVTMLYQSMRSSLASPVKNLHRE